MGVPHGTVQITTAGEIVDGGGSVVASPEFDDKVGQINYQHVSVTLGDGSNPFGDPWQEGIPGSWRFGRSGYPYGWNPNDQ
jgi:hypothetical protein